MNTEHQQTLRNSLRPFTLVWVNEREARTPLGDVQYVGEVMSWRIPPDGTYMVRRVPGHPGTLVELPERCLSRMTNKGPGSMRYVHYAVVAGHGSFPVDMLRYDNCTPVNFDIEWSEAGAATIKRKDNGIGPLLVAKAAPTLTFGRWTEARWESFGWSLRPVQAHSIDERINY